MRLVASVMVGAGEEDRYLVPFLDHLLEFCDLICVRYEGPADTFIAHPSIEVLHVAPSFFAHEGRARQELLDFTLAQQPTHVLSIDADEFVTNGALLRQVCASQRNVGVWTLNMREVWGADMEGLSVRNDGAWRPHPIPILYAPEKFRRRPLTINQKALACGREPTVVAAMRGRARPSGSDVLHLGWACVADRAARHQRYVEHDGGKFHRNPHLDSIMWPDSKVGVERLPWPAALAGYRDEIVERASRGQAVISEPTEVSCLCGNVTVAVMPGQIDFSGLRCWMCPREEPPRPTLRLVK